MENVYERLAAKLDELPHGFPRTASNVELRILAKVFSPEDAAMALQLLPIPETVEVVAHRLSRPVDELRGTLDGMVRRGQIGSIRLRGEQVYGLVPFVVGIYEFQLPRLDAELAALFEEYAATLLKAVGGSKPALARVVPVNLHIEAKAEVLRYESMREMLNHARSFHLMECICRKQRALQGSPCTHTLETCMAFSSEEDAYDGTLPAGYGRSVTREEALAVLDRTEREGLVHCTYNVRRNQMFVCNCCTCCCGFLRGVKEFNAPNTLVRSNYVSSIDPDDCTACGECATGRCPMDAIVERDGAYGVIGERCIGCGVCTLVCPVEAIAMRPRRRAEQTVPPRDIVTWSFRRVVHRRGVSPAIVQFGGLALQAMRGRRAGRRPPRPNTTQGPSDPKPTRSER